MSGTAGPASTRWHAWRPRSASTSNSFLVKRLTKSDLIGEVGAGPGVDVEYPPGEKLRVAEFFPGDVVAFKVRGTSMIGDLIGDGDYVVIRRNPEAGHGEKVIVWLGAESVMLLKLLKIDTNGRKWIDGVPSGKARRQILEANGDAIRGVLLGVIRRE